MVFSSAIISSVSYTPATTIFVPKASSSASIASVASLQPHATTVVYIDADAATSPTTTKYANQKYIDSTATK
jgi:hypothetical protein